jgi:SH3-like domain-containing protein
MKAKNWLILFALCGVVFSLAASVGAQSGRVDCNFSTYLEDEDTNPDNGTNIRAKPDRNSAIIRTLGGKNNDEVTSADGVVVKVTGFSNGWFEVSRVEQVGDSDKVLFEERGWLHSSLLGMSVGGADPRLYAEPRHKSRILMKLKVDESPLKLLACQGEWVKVETGGKIGWLSPGGQCGNPLTTCP